MRQQLRIRGQFVKISKKERSDIIRAASQLYRRPDKSIISLDDNISDSLGGLTPPTISTSGPFQLDTQSTSRVPDSVDVTGSHIVEIDHLAKQLYCNDFGKQLNLNTIVNEKTLWLWICFDDRV